MTGHNEQSIWWGTFAIPDREERFWQIGPLKMWIYRAADEWQITLERAGDPFEETLTVAARADRKPGPKAETTRFGFRQTAESIELVPALADRAVVVNPHVPFVLPPGEEATVYMSSPLWVRLVTGGQDLIDEPIFRPSDTWLGPSTRVGELCYASRTGARLHHEDLPIRPQRALSAVLIRNRAPSQLPLERVRLPAANLSLFTSSRGDLWTETATLDREEDGEMAALRLNTEPPAVAPDTALVSGPREQVARGALVRAFGSSFSLRMVRAFERLAD